MPIRIKHRRTKAHDAGQQCVHHPRHTTRSHLGQQGVHLGLGAGQVGALQLLGAGQLFAHQRGNRFRCHMGRKTAAGGRRQQRHHVAQPQVGGDGLGRLFPVHDGGAVVAPHGQRQRVADLLHQRGHTFTRQAHRVQPRQGGQAQLQCCGPQVITRGAAVLHHQAQALEADQVAVRLGGTHAGAGGQVAQHQRAGGLGQHVQQRKPDLQRLDARAGLVRLGFAVACFGFCHGFTHLH